MMKSTRHWFVATASIILVACGSASPTTSDVTGGPAWTTRGGGLFETPHGKGFYAVGIGTSKNAHYRRKQSDNRARAELAKVFSSQVTSLYKDYLSSVSNGEIENFEEKSEEVSQVFSKIKLPLSQVIDHWVSGDGNEYALAYLDMDAFEKTIDGVQTLSKGEAAAIKARADAAHKALEKRRTQ